MTPSFLQPTVRKDILDLCARIGSIPGLRTFGITTNGLVLKRMLPALASAKVTHLNISLDTLIPEKFERITRRAGFSRVMEAILAAVDQGFVPLKV